MWSLVDTDGEVVVMPIVTPGPPGTAETRRRAEELRDLDRTQLDRIRATAEKWRNGLVVLTGLITTVGVVKGRDSLEDLSSSAQVVLGILMLLALVCAAVGALLAMLAAFGLPTLYRLTGDALEFSRIREEQTTQASRNLRLAVVFSCLTLLFLASASAVNFYGPLAAASLPPMLQVSTPQSGTVCGELVSSSAGRVTIDTSTGQVEIELEQAVVRLATVC